MKKLKKPSIIISSAIGTCLIVFVGLFILHTVAKGKILPNTSFLGLELGFKNITEADAQLSAHYDYITESAQVTIQGEGGAQSYTYADLGFKFDPLKPATETVRVYGENATFGDLLRSLVIGTHVPLVMASDPARAELVLYQDFKEFKKSSNPFFRVRNNKLEAVDGYIGHEFSWDFLYLGLVSSLNQLPGEDETIVLQNILVLPEIKLNSIKSQKEFVQSVIDRDYVLASDTTDDTVTLTDDQVLNLIRFKLTGSDITPFVDALNLSDLIGSELQDVFATKPGAVLISYNQETGQAEFGGKYQDGTEINPASLKEALENTFFEPDADSKLIIPTKTVLGMVNTDEYLASKGVTGLYAQGHTSFYGSANNRVHNISVGLERFNGHIIEPGKEFSFNTILGAVDASTGYKPELVIKKEGTIPEYGGGLCQVSTTLYRAVLNADLEVTDRRPHSYAVSYYAQQLGHGLDATIYPGSSDFKFKNTTDTPLVVQAYREGANAYFLLYGKENPLQVAYDGPYISAYTRPGGPQYFPDNSLAPGAKVQVEKAHTGFDVLWYKIVTHPDGRVEKKEIFSRYKAIPAKFKVGPDLDPENATAEETDVVASL